MLTAAFDESGSHAAAQYVTVACYIADVQQWERFTRCWVQALWDAGVKIHKPPLPGEPSTPFFHMTDWESRWGQFKGWDNEKRVRLFKRLANLIDQHTVLGIGMSVDQVAYADIIAPTMPEDSGYRDPYMWCLQTCMEILYQTKSREGFYGIRVLDPEPFACVVEDGHSVSHRITEYYGRFRRY